MNKQVYEHTVGLALSKTAGIGDIWEAIKQHLKDNKKHYIRGGVGALAGAGLGAGIVSSINTKSPGAWVGGVLGGAGVGAGAGVGGGMLYDYIVSQNRRRTSKRTRELLEKARAGKMSKADIKPLTSLFIAQGSSEKDAKAMANLWYNASLQGGQGI